MLETTIRLGMTDDLPFVLSSWTTCMRHIYPNQYVFHFQEDFHHHISNILSKSILLISCLSSDPNEIISYLIYSSFKENMVIHFGYTKLDARGAGILHSLIEYANPNHLPIIFTHPPKSEKLMIELCQKHIFHPGELL